MRARKWLGSWLFKWSEVQCQSRSILDPKEGIYKVGFQLRLLQDCKVLATMGFVLKDAQRILKEIHLAHARKEDAYLSSEFAFIGTCGHDPFWIPWHLLPQAYMRAAEAVMEAYGHPYRA